MRYKLTTLLGLLGAGCSASSLGSELASGLSERGADFDRTARALLGSEASRAGNLPLARELTRREAARPAAIPSTAGTLASRETSHAGELPQARELAKTEVARTGSLPGDAARLLAAERGTPPRLGVAFDVLLELWRREADIEGWRRPPPIKL